MTQYDDSTQNTQNHEEEEEELAPWLVEGGSSDDEEEERAVRSRAPQNLDPKSAALARAREIAIQKASKLKSSKKHPHTQPSLTTTGISFHNASRWKKIQLPKFVDSNIFDPSFQKSSQQRSTSTVLDIFSATMDDDDMMGSGNSRSSEKVRIGTIVLPRNLTPTQTQAFLINFRVEEILLKLYNQDFSQEPRENSPVPEYDGQGNIINSFEQRARQSLLDEKSKLLQKAKQLDPAYKTTGLQNPIAKLTAKVLIPVDKYPGYNFPGLLLGPLGRTQQAMSRETGAKIELRGRGMNKKVKPGSPEEDEEPHVNITADNEVSLQKAVAAVKRILIVTDDSQNLHKQRQLRELEKIRGTSRDLLCPICGTPGHQAQDCPANQNRANPNAAPATDSSYKSFLESITSDGSMVSSNMALLIPSERGGNEPMDQADSTTNWWLSKAEDAPKITADTLPGAPPPLEYLSSRSHFAGGESGRGMKAFNSGPPGPPPQNPPSNAARKPTDTGTAAAIARARAASHNRN